MADNNTSRLYEFLKSLSEDPKKLAEFEEDAERAMAAAGLTEAEQDLVKSGDEERIMSHLGGEAGAARVFRVIRIRNIRIRFGV